MNCFVYLSLLISLSLYWIALYEEGEIIRSTKKTIDVVLPNLPTNKILLFMQMWHYLVIFIFIPYAD